MNVDRIERDPAGPAKPVDHVGGRVAWREAGTGTPVLFLHGLGGTRGAWGPQLRGLSGAHRCIAWDMPGYGDSEPLAPLTYPAIADALVAFLDELSLDQVDLVGLSFGGMQALHTAIRHPRRVRCMVLADTSPAFGMDGTIAQEWISSRLAPLEAGGSIADAAEHVIDAITARPLTGAVREETINAFRNISNEGFRLAVRCLPTNDVRAELSQLHHRCCVIVGELDYETPVSYAKTLADELPNTEFHILAGIGHLSPAEAPDQFNEVISAFLAG
ncbi:MAG: alpha/beta fold hydrolase [Acidimicrobiales bacterium]